MIRILRAIPALLLALAVMLTAGSIEAADIGALKAPAAATPTQSKPVCELGSEFGNNYLLGQAGGLATKEPTVNPWADCEYRGFFVSDYAYVALRGIWKYEDDGLIGYRGTNGPWDYVARIGVYHIDTGTGLIDIFNSRVGAGYTFKSGDVSLRLHAIADDQKMFRGPSNENTFGLAGGATLAWNFAPRLTVTGMVESWWHPKPGFFETGKPNFKFVPGLTAELNHGFALRTSVTFMKGNQFDPLDHKLYTMWTAALSKKF